MADDSADTADLPTSPYLLQPLRTLQQAEQDSQSAQRRRDSKQVELQDSQSPSLENLGQPQGRRTG